MSNFSLQPSVERATPDSKIIGLAGNPNVGKSTVFNSLTGMRQHTGNWPGKTVASACGDAICGGYHCTIVDLPGTYSLMAHSVDEEVARNFICTGGADAVMVVCDATCLERNLNLVLQTIEITPNVVVCVNLMDEARKKGIKIDIPRLSQLLGVAVVPTCARSNKGLRRLTDAVAAIIDEPQTPASIRYTQPVEQAISYILPYLKVAHLNPRWLAVRLLEEDSTMTAVLESLLEPGLMQNPNFTSALLDARHLLAQSGYTGDHLRDLLVSCIVLTAEDVCSQVLSHTSNSGNTFDRRLDGILTGKLTAFPLMAVLLAGIFWLTIVGANYPSALLSDLLFSAEKWLFQAMNFVGAPLFLSEMLVHGVYRVTAWVVAVMLPPMAIFFPLFTLLEDFGYLPRVAFNLDRGFKKCGACGKQALSMCMGFGCNAAGITGCRIIDSPRERIIAMLTNNFVPCNGRFPTLIAIISMFFVIGTAQWSSSILSAIFLTAVILLGVTITFFVSWLLSRTILRGTPSSFTLELPPYRRPQIGRVLVRSVLDRTLFVLGRAVSVAAPAGLIIWLLANISVGDTTLLANCSQFLDPVARIMGLDGVILLAFILGFPANEIVLPIVIMCYASTSSISNLESLSALKQLLVQNDWTWVTAVCTMLFSLMHWPCSTTLLTIRKESQSLRWTAAAFIIPTICGILTCVAVATAARIFGLVG